MKEIWKPISEYDFLYEISNMGRVRSLKKWDVNSKSFIPCMNILKPTDNGNGYLIIGLRKGGKRKNYYIHRLVAQEFLSNDRNLKCVNHIDYDKRNNTVENLEWCTQLDNVRHSSEHMKHKKGITHSNTGEKYITYSKGKYRVIIDRKEYPSFLNLKEAILFRDEVLKEVI